MKPADEIDRQAYPVLFPVFIFASLTQHNVQSENLLFQLKVNFGFFSILLTIFTNH